MSEALRTSQRERLTQLARHSRGGLVRVDEAAESLGLKRSVVAQALARWTRQGWLSRINRGLYAIVPLGSNPSVAVVEDSWLVVTYVFPHSYFSGWTAASHWDFTEQVFNTLIVCTDLKVRRSDIKLDSIQIRAKHVNTNRFFGLQSVWRANQKILIADPHKTIIDMIEDPSIGGGIDHVFACLKAYLNSERYRSETFLEYIDKTRNGTINKRLGYLVSRFLPEASSILEHLSVHLTSGVVKLDPHLSCTKLVNEWGLRIPPNWRPR